MKYKAILFDMDGVLIESEFLMRHSAIQALADYGITAKHEDFLPFTGMGEDKFVGGVAEKYGHTYVKAMKELSYDYYGQQVKDMTDVPEGIKEMLTTLHEKGLILAVCSAADLRKVKYNIQAIGVDESIFTALVTGSDVTRKKPFPDIYLEGARRVGIEPKDCLVVEDAISGIQAAHAAGMDAAAVPTTFSKEALLQEKPEYMMNHIKELTGLFA
ncbi:MAG: HAD-IA family hydrolase [Oscillospiraceae bacterium]|nr:HAD-IA family hydrolase [Oscillospiraceae bacterium]